MEIVSSSPVLGLPTTGGPSAISQPLIRSGNRKVQERSILLIKTPKKKREGKKKKKSPKGPWQNDIWV